MPATIRIALRQLCAFGIRRLTLYVKPATIFRLLSKQRRINYVTLLSIGLWSKKEDPKVALYNRADYLYDEYQIDSLVKYLKDAFDPNDLELVWRYARAVCELGKISKDPVHRRNLFNEAYDIAKAGIALPEAKTCFAVHKWYAIILNYTSELNGTKEQLLRSFEVKEHFMKAVEINPDDPTSWHLLGLWAFTFADLAWYKRKLAAAVFASPPESSYEEALQYFERAEKISPEFYSQNLLSLGKVHLKMGDKERAKYFFDRAVHFEISTQDDVDAHDDAKKLLGSL